MTNSQENLVQSLSLLGLDKNDATIYLTLLDLGTARVWDIAKLSGIKRPTCYLILESLAKRGFVQKAHDAKHVEFSAIAPKKILDIFELKRQQFFDNINELVTLASKTEEKPIVRVYEGLEGLKLAFDLILKQENGSEFVFYSRNTLEQKFADFSHEFMQKRTKKDIRCRGIFPDSVGLINTLPPRDSLELRKSRFIPNNIFNPAAETFIAPGVIFNLIFTQPKSYIIVIESKSLADAEKANFDLMWEIAKVPKN